MNVAQLEELPVGSKVRDGSMDIWSKDDEGLWSWDEESAGDTFKRWTSARLKGYYAGDITLEYRAPENEAVSVPEVAGVWLVAYDWKGYDMSLKAVFPGDQELEARRWSDVNYNSADVVFVPFGEVE